MGRTYLRGEKRAVALAKGGITSMFGKQAAGPDKPGNTGKDQSAAPGAKSARRHDEDGRTRQAKPGRAGAR